MPTKIRHLPIAGILIFAVSLVSAIRLLVYTGEFSVNMMFWDQWDFYRPLFDGSGLIEAFRWQHGPHRQGLGAILIGVVAWLTAWDGRGDAFLVAGALILSTVLALWLKYRLIGKWSAFDMWIPVLFLSLGQYELVTIVPNVAAGALPLMLVLALALALTLKGTRTQALALVVIGFLLLYTGYGFLPASVLPLLFLYRALRPAAAGFDAASRPIWIAALIASLASIVSYYVDWKFTAAVACYGTSQIDPLQYVEFSGLMIGQGFGLVPVADQIVPANLFAMTVGIGLAVGSAGIAVMAGTTRVGVIFATLIGFSLVLVVSTAIGRVCLGALGQPLSSRYMTLVLPMILGVYLWAATGARSRHLVIGCGILGLIALSQVGPFFRDPNILLPVLYRNARLEWKSCYLGTLDPYKCDALASQQMYPSTERIIGRLRYLESHRLNLFKGVPWDVEIKNPEDGSRIQPGAIDLVGTVNPPDFVRYQLQWGVGEFPNDWNWLSGPHLAIVRDGSLGRWETSGLAPGVYTVRLTAFTADGRQRVSVVRLVQP